MNAKLLPQIALALTLALLVRVLPATASSWTPEQWQDASSLQIWTIDANQNEHWSTVWLVVIRGEVYIRLGTAAADRLRNSIQFPYVKVRIRGQEFSTVRTDIMNNMAATVADAMAEKYWSDMLVRYLPHPMTVRLVGPR
jgi:hypothetical protein